MVTIIICLAWVVSIAIGWFNHRLLSNKQLSSNIIILSLTTGGWTGTTTTTIQGGGGAGGAGGGGLGVDWQQVKFQSRVLTDQPTREPEIVLGLREEGIGLRKKWRLH